MRTACLQLGELRFLVIDEADRLLEMGFERNVRQIVEHIHLVTRNRSSAPLQTSLLSATLTSGVEKLAGLALHNPVICTVSDVPSPIKRDLAKLDTLEYLAGQFAMPAGLRHFVLLVPWKLRLVSLAAFILLKCRYHKHGGKLIVFMATQHCVDFHYKLFKSVLCPDDEENIVPTDVSNLSLYRLHGSMEHSDREKVFHKFSAGSSGILITTDVASRGLDLASVAWVVQYHVTGSPVDYVHRVGRTARAGGQGKALLILDQQETGLLQLLRAQAGVVFETLSLLDLMQTALFYVKQHSKRSERTARPATVEEGVSRFSHLMMDAVAEDEVLSSLAETAYLSFLRSYASFSAEMRQFLIFKHLHLGHVARAFCLQATPKDVALRVTGRHAAKRRTISSKRSFKTESSATIESGNSFSRQSASLAFAEKLVRTSNQRSKIKPSEKAAQNMLAEFGL